jgi:hypothetical protein
MRVQDNIKNFDDLSINVSDMAVTTEYNFHKLDIPFIDLSTVFLVGVDVGFSSVKVYSVYGRHKFPSLVYPIEAEDIKKVLFKKDTFIAYRDKDKTGKTWLVGDVISETKHEKIADEYKLFTEKRVGSDENIVLNRVGIALSLMQKPGKFKRDAEIKIAVGLPEEYDLYASTLIDQLSGYHEFELQIGKNEEWIPVSFIIREENIDVLSQPFGTLLSIAVNRKGEIIDEYLLQRAKCCVCDSGFLTSDTFILQGGMVGDCITWENRAMKAIYEKLLDKCKAATNRDLGLHQINNYLMQPKEKRYISYGRGGSWQIDPVLNELIDQFAKENIKELSTFYDNFNEIDLMIMTGGTSKLYYPYFIVGLPNLEIRIAEKHDSKKDYENFNCVFANCVGFFNYVIMKYRAEINFTEPKEEIINEAAATEIETL